MPMYVFSHVLYCVLYGLAEEFGLQVTALLSLQYSSPFLYQNTAGTVSIQYLQPPAVRLIAPSDLTFVT